MGSTSAEAIDSAEGLELTARLDLGDPIEQVIGAEAVLVFTTPDVAMDQVRWCVEQGLHVVVGTSGFDDAKVAELRDLIEAHPGVGVLVVPNFSIGAVLMMRFARTAAPFFESAEIIEMHHPQKVDAPSGTAVRTAEIIAGARASAGLGSMPDATASDPDGARGASVAGIPVHAIRARGFTASQELVFGDPGEIFSIRHDSTSRESFMPGVLAALRAVGDRPGVTVGLDAVLGLE